MPQDEPVAGPEACGQTQDADDQAQQDAQRDQVAQRFGLQEARVGVALHGLEDVVFGVVEDLRVVAVLVFDGDDHAVDDGLGEDDLALRARQDECVEDLLGRGAQVRPRDGVAGGRGGEVAGIHEGGAGWAFVAVGQACACVGVGVGAGVGVGRRGDSVKVEV